MITDLDR